MDSAAAAMPSDASLDGGRAQIAGRPGRQVQVPRHRENLKNRQEIRDSGLEKRLRIRVGGQRTWQWVAEPALHIGGPGAVRPGSQRTQDLSHWQALRFSQP